MPGTFFGITIGQSGLAAAQLGEDITGQNIANAGTPGYSVQTLDQTASDPYTNADRATLLTPGLIGTGVSIRSIQRAGDQFLDTQVRDANSGLQGQTAQSDALKQVGSVFGEPSATGLNAALTSFFNAFHDLANSPESAGVRAATVQQGVSLAHTFGTVSAGLASVASGVAGRTASAVEEINSDSAQIAALNVSIRASTRGGQTPNDLVDRRGVLLDNLAGLTNISVQNTADGGVNVSVGSTALVAGSDSFAASLPSLLAAGVSGGTLGGLHAASLQVAALQTQLHAAAASVASQVNAAQANGLDLSGNPGTPFFTATAGSEAGTLAVSADLLAHPDHLAAASVPAPPATFGAGDGSNAQAVAGLLSKTVTAAGDPLAGQSIQSFYQATVSTAGSQAAAALAGQKTAQAIQTQFSNQRSSETGVSTDTELANLLKYQRAYQASARVITTADDLIGTLINNLFSGR